MAGIFAVYKKKGLPNTVKNQLNKAALRLKHRGVTRTFKFERFPLEITYFQMKVHEESMNLAVDQSSNSLFLFDGNMYNLANLLKDLNQKDQKKLLFLLTQMRF